jgi:hypothetical protein
LRHGHEHRELSAVRAGLRERQPTNPRPRAPADATMKTDDRIPCLQHRGQQGRDFGAALIKPSEVGACCHVSRRQLLANAQPRVSPRSRVSGCGPRDGREHLIDSASTAIERFANGIGNDASPSAALTAANEVPRCIVVCERHGAYLSRSTI